MNIVVTGATGFIGRHVVAEIEARGWSATLLVRASSRVPAQWSQRHRVIQPHAPHGPADTMIHLAWAGLPNYKSLHHFEQELPAQYRFIQKMVAAGIKHVVVAGTCFEYGMQSGMLTEYFDARPANPYGFAKDALRRQITFLQETQPFTLTWGRLFYMHGADQTGSSLFPLLRSAATRGDKQFPMSGGEQLRDYLPVAEVARHLVALAATQRDNGIVNICSGQPISVRRLVEGWIADNGWNIQPQLGQLPYPQYEPMAFWGERSKLDRCLIAT